MIFVYGTLQNSQVYELVTKASFDDDFISQATLENYKCVYVKDEEFPGLIKDKDSSVDGVLLNPSEQTIKLLSVYEGEEYDLITVEVQALEKKESAQTFVYKDLTLLTQNLWDYKEWIQKIDLSAYLKRVENLLLTGDW